MFESVCLFVCLSGAYVTQKRKRMIPKCSILGYPKNDMVMEFQGYRLGLELGTAIRRGFELYECLLVIMIMIININIIAVAMVNQCIRGRERKAAHWNR